MRLKRNKQRRKDDRPFSSNMLPVFPLVDRKCSKNFTEPLGVAKGIFRNTDKRKLIIPSNNNRREKTSIENIYSEPIFCENHRLEYDKEGNYTSTNDDGMLTTTTTIKSDFRKDVCHISQCYLSCSDFTVHCVSDVSLVSSRRCDCDRDNNIVDSYSTGSNSIYSTCCDCSNSDNECVVHNPNPNDPVQISQHIHHLLMGKTGKREIGEASDGKNNWEIEKYASEMKDKNVQIEEVTNPAMNEKKFNPGKARNTE